MCLLIPNLITVQIATGTGSSVQWESKPKPVFHILSLYAKFVVPITGVHGSEMRFLELNFFAVRRTVGQNVMFCRREAKSTFRKIYYFL